MTGSTMTTMTTTKTIDPLPELINFPWALLQCHRADRDVNGFGEVGMFRHAELARTHATN